MKQARAEQLKRNEDDTERAEAVAARMEFALRHARMRPGELHKRLQTDYNIHVSRSSIYEAINGKVARPKYINEYANILQVDPTWLATGKGLPTDISGVQSNREKAGQTIRQLLREYIVPHNRNDLIRLCDRFLERVEQKRMNEKQVHQFNRILTQLTRHEMGNYGGREQSVRSQHDAQQPDEDKPPSSQG